MSKSSKSSLKTRAKPLVIAGICLAGLGLLILLAFFLSSLRKTEKFLQVQGTPQASQVLKIDQLTMSYLDSWKLIDMSQRNVCQVSGVKCFISLGTTHDDGTNFSVIRYNLAKDSAVADVDKGAWDLFIANTADVKLDSMETMTVGGTPAVRRTYNMPSEMSPNGRAFVQQIYIANGLYLYETVFWAPSDYSLNQNQADVDAMVNSIRFTP